MPQLRAMLFSLAAVLVFISAAEAITSQEAEKVIQERLEAQAQITGTLDIYDEKNDTVRNLRFQKKDGVEEIANGFRQVFTFRDINTGEIIRAAAIIATGENTAGFKDWEIQDIRPPEHKSEGAGEKASDEDIKETVKEYFEKRSKFTGSYDLFDPAAEKMRKLQFQGIEGDLRRYGILAIAHVKTLDTETGETVYLDVTTENKDGRLNVTKVAFAKAE